MHEPVVKPQLQHLRALRQEALAPAAQGFGVVLAERKFVHHLQPGGLRRAAEFTRAGQAAAREDVLLDEVGGVHVAVPQAVVDHDALDTRAAAGFEQVVHLRKVGGPVFAAHGFDHLDGADGVERAVLDVAVVLQAQVGVGRHGGNAVGAVHALAGKRELFGGQGDASDRCAEFVDRHVHQCAPAAANLEHPVAALHAGHLQCAPHLGVLGVWQGFVGLALEPGGRVVHGVVQPQAVERVAQVVMCVDILACCAA